MTLADREAEARRVFPLGAIRLTGKWHRVQSWRDKLGAGDFYLPLATPDSPCPECVNGMVVIGPFLGAFHPVDGYDPCSICNGTGSIPNDSILSRVRKGEWP